MASRDLADLTPDMRAAAEQVIETCREQGIDLIICCTHRTHEEQARLFCQGRTRPDIQARADDLDAIYGRPDLAAILMAATPQGGMKTTNAAPGQSSHHYGLAFDAVPVRDGRVARGIVLPADREMWQTYGAAAYAAGLSWAGGWRNYKEYPHAQERGYDWHDLIRNVDHPDESKLP